MTEEKEKSVEEKIKNVKMVRDFIVGLSALLGVFALIMLLIVIIMLFSYGSGWLIGWLMNCVLNIDTVFGLYFEQLIGLMTLFSSMLVSSVVTTQNILKKKDLQKTNNYVEKAIVNALKKYRGY